MFLQRGILQWQQVSESQAELRRQEVCAYRAKTSAVSAAEHNARSFSTADTSICIASAAQYSAGPSLQLAGFTALRETRITRDIFVMNPQGKQPMGNRRR
jgi:uncharacterized caspase-like protein